MATTTTRTTDPVTLAVVATEEAELAARRATIRAAYALADAQHVHAALFAAINEGRITTDVATFTAALEAANIEARRLQLAAGTEHDRHLAALTRLYVAEAAART